jgi:hypothetical protein
MSYISKIRPQAAEDTQENGSWYGECASGRRIYAYVGNDPINRVDPTGLCDNPAGCGGGSGNPSSALIQATNQLQADLQLGTNNQLASNSGLTQTTATGQQATQSPAQLISLTPSASPLVSYQNGQPTSITGTQLAAGGPTTFWCRNVACGAPYGGGDTAPLRPNCARKLLNGNGGNPMRLENGVILQPGTNLFPDDDE